MPGSVTPKVRAAAALAVLLPLAAIVAVPISPAAGAVVDRQARPVVVAGNHLVRLTWTAPAEPPQLYVITIHEADGSEIDSIVVPATDTTMTVAPLVNGETYRFGVGRSAEEGTLSARVTPRAFCTVVGTPGDDRLVGTPGDDAICGRGGDDTMRGLAGGDSYVGGSGRDTVDYRTEPEAVDAVLDFSSSLYPGLGLAEFATSLDLEAIVADGLRGSAFDDELRGTLGDDDLGGGPGDDVLGNPFGDFLAGGDDTLRGGAGSDRLLGVVTGSERYFGGGGADVADLRFAPGPVVANLDAHVVRGGGDDAPLGFVIGVERVHGSEFRDTLGGNDHNNVLIGDGGPDRIAGAGGNDRVVGGAGNDGLSGGRGTDLCYGGGGTDTATASCETIKAIPR